MKTIEKKTSATKFELDNFINQINSKFPNGYIDFIYESNGAFINSDDIYYHLWDLEEIIQLNKDYEVETFAPNFFVFGSDGGDIALAIEKTTGYIYEIPFIGMSNEEAIFKYNTFTDFLNCL